jgi:hypothetical protein
MKVARILCVLLVIAFWVVPATVLARSKAEIPTPESVLGFVPGTDRELMDYEQLVGYMQKLAAASSSVEMLEFGTTPLGRPMYVAFISSSENLERLDELKDINRRLALDPAIPAEDLADMVARGKVFVMETLSMHSGEVGPSQSLPILA